MKPLFIILSGAGISADSGLNTFRDQDGLWENHRIEDVATPEAWNRDPVLVQRFYNERRRGVLNAKPNAAHLALKRLEEKFDVRIITQNIDDLHERAGSSNVLHLHGLITRSQSSLNPQLTYPIEGWELKMDEYCALGSPLRPHVVWFGEPVPNMTLAAEWCAEADYFALIGSSLQVYPAAGLTTYLSEACRKFYVDVRDPGTFPKYRKYIKRAAEGVPEMVEELMG